jgi:hypothetical protein
MRSEESVASRGIRRHTGLTLEPGVAATVVGTGRGSSPELAAERRDPHCCLDLVGGALEGQAAHRGAPGPPAPRGRRLDGRPRTVLNRRRLPRLRRDVPRGLQSVVVRGGDPHEIQSGNDPWGPQRACAIRSRTHRRGRRDLRGTPGPGRTRHRPTCRRQGPQDSAPTPPRPPGASTQDIEETRHG